METMRIKSKTNPVAAAAALVKLFGDTGPVEVEAIGARAVNQAMKAVIIGTGRMAENGINAICVPGFVVKDVDGNSKTAIRLIVKKGRKAVAGA